MVVVRPLVPKGLSIERSARPKYELLKHYCRNPREPLSPPPASRGRNSSNPRISQPPGFKDEMKAHGKSLSKVAPPMPPMPPRPVWYRRTPDQSQKCTDNGERRQVARSKVHSLQRKTAPDNRRAPKQGGDPSARKPVGTSFVRVGSRVSFNTVVAAILIPSAKDLHAAARQELW